MRGLSVHYLTHLLPGEVPRYESEDCTVATILESVIMAKGKHLRCRRHPGATGTSYVDAVPDFAEGWWGKRLAGRARFMLSYTWRYRVQDIVDSIHGFFQQSAHPEACCIWICAFCVNQWHVQNTTVDFATFKQRFEGTVDSVTGVLAMLGSWGQGRMQYTDRVWCVFELFTAITKGKDLHIVMPPRERESFGETVLGGEVLPEIWKSVSNIDAQQARATVQADYDNIKGLVEASCGWKRLNRSVVERLHHWFAVSSRDALLKRLSGSGGLSEETVSGFARVATFFHHLGDYASSEELLRCASRIVSAQGWEQTQLHAMVLQRWADTERRLLRTELASSLMRRSVQLAKELGSTDSKEYAYMLRDLGRCEGDFGDLKAEGEHFEEALMLMKRHGTKSDEAAVRRSLGLLKYQLREAAAAKEHLEASLRLHKDARPPTDRSPEAASTHKSLGDLHLEGDAFQEAERAYLKALEIMKDLGLEGTPLALEPVCALMVCAEELGKEAERARWCARAQEMQSELQRESVPLAGSGMIAGALSRCHRLRTADSPGHSCARPYEERVTWGAYFEMQAEARSSTAGFPFALGMLELQPTAYIEGSRQIAIAWSRWGSRATSCRKWTLESTNHEPPWMSDLRELRMGEVEGVLSPVSEVNLPGETRKQLGIPQEAMYFMWSYPVDFGCCLDSMEERDPDKAFLLYGGYVYLARDLRTIVKVLAVRPTRSDASGGAASVLHFGEAKQWDLSWTSPLLAKERFQPLTIAALKERVPKVEELREAGPTHFCWIRPQECMWSWQRRARTYICPFGGFAYVRLARGPSHSAS